jgi:hypothetical protein
LTREIDSFFQEITAKSKEGNNAAFDIYYICVREFHWGYEQIMDTDIPFILDMIDRHIKAKKEEANMIKKANKRR